MIRKFLYSPAYGARWATWVDDRKMQEYVLFYEPIIEFIEGGGSFKSEDHPLLVKLIEECKEKFDEDFYVGGATDLKVGIVDGPFYLKEYDGYESYITHNSDGWF